MSKNQSVLHRKKLVMAMSLIITGSAISGCSSSDGGSTGGGETGSFTIQANGGTGGDALGAQGGNGGELYVINEGTNGGVEISKSGSASIDITRPAVPTTPDLGSNPLVISANTHIDTPVLYTALAHDNAAGLNVDELYMGLDSTLRVSAAGGNTNYTNDLLVSDGSFYRSSLLPDELYQAVGPELPADLALADLAPANIAYLIDEDSDILMSDADDTVSDLIYTGLSVAAGATLSLANNDGCVSTIQFSNDIDNNGRIVKAELDECSLELRSNYYYATGDVSNEGSTVSDGGNINIFANRGITNSGAISVNGFTEAADSSKQGGDAGSILLSAVDFIINSGQINAMGGDGDAAGDGGSIDISDGSSYTENSGAINISGGNDIAAGGGSGGQGGSMSMDANVVMYNTKEAMITANGGNGESGGDAGSVSFSQNYDEGALLNAGTIVTSGGVGNVFNGGDGGSISMYTETGGQLQNTGDLSSNGGDTTGEEDGEGGLRGGNGGFLSLNTNNENDNIAPGEIVISGNLSANGGNAPAAGDGSGGDAGDIQIYNDVSNVADERIALLGYTSIDLNGGDGRQGGQGSGVNNNGVNIRANSYDTDVEVAAGSVSNEVPINARGGNSTATGDDVANGGSGGNVDIFTVSSDLKAEHSVNMTNSANIDVSGGTSFGVSVETDAKLKVRASGNGGSVYLYGFDEATNSGSINANAGSNGSTRRRGGSFEMESDGATNNSGAITANGSEGGNGGYIGLFGVSITNSAALSVDGGSTVDNITTTGGNGGLIELLTDLSANPANNGSFSYQFGTSEAGDGLEGCATVNIVTEGNCESINLEDGLIAIPAEIKR